MKKLISTICAIALIILNITTVFGAEFSGDNFELTLANCSITNLYTEGEEPSVRIKVSNDSDVDLTGNYICVVTTPSGEEVLRISKNITVNENTNRTYRQALDVTECGIYTLNVTMGGEFGNVSKSVKFAILKSTETRNPKIGTCVHFDLDVRNEKLDETHNLTQSASFGWVRDDLRWERMQSKVDGEITVPAYRDKEINAHIDAGNKVLLILDYGNPNYGNRFPKTDEEIKAYAKYCKAVAQHYMGKVDAFEIYNEPDYSGFAKWEITGADYVKVLKAASTAIREVQPEATIVAGALCSMRWPTARAREIATQIFEQPNVTDYMDAFSFHSYDYVEEPPGSMYSDSVYSDESKVTTFTGQVEFIKGLLAKTSKPNLPIWITEDGMPSDAIPGTNEVIQAEDTARMLAAVAANPQVEKYFIYNLHEKTHSSLKENAFGIVDKNYEPKPAYAAAAFSNLMLNGVECTYKFEGGNTVYQGEALGGYGFKSDNKEVYVAWAHTGKDATLKISKTRAGGAKSVFSKVGSTGTIAAAKDADIKIYDMYGKRVEYKSTLKLTSEPLYVEIAPSATTFERNGSLMTVKGQTDEGNRNVTLIARQKENTERILALKQVKSNAMGEFVFNVEIPSDKNFYIYVYDGNIKESAHYGSIDYSVSPRLFINQVRKYDLSDLKDGDKIDLEIDVSGEAIPQNLMFYGAVYKSSGLLVKVDKQKADVDQNKASAKIEFFIEDAADVDNIKYMLWDENMIPLTQMTTFK